MSNKKSQYQMLEEKHKGYVKLFGYLIAPDNVENNKHVGHCDEPLRVF